AEEPRSLALAAGVLPVHRVLLADQVGVVAEATAARLVREAHVVDRLLDLVDVLLLVRVEQVEALVVADPEDAAAELAGMAVQEVGPRRVGVPLADRDASTHVLPPIVVEIPAAQR